jgi:hypothetical protein
MQEIAYCPWCGRKREGESSSCSGCGKSFALPASTASVEGRKAGKPYDRSVARAWGILFLSVFIILGIMAAGTYVQQQNQPKPLSCEEAQQVVYNRHPGAYTFMERNLGAWWDCSRYGNAFDETARLITLEWIGRDGQRRSATWLVMPDRFVRPNNDTAILIDKGEGDPNILRQLTAE